MSLETISSKILNNIVRRLKPSQSEIKETILDSLVLNIHISWVPEKFQRKQILYNITELIPEVIPQNMPDDCPDTVLRLRIKFTTERSLEDIMNDIDECIKMAK